MTQERAAIIRGKLVIMHGNGCVSGLGIRNARAGIAQIEASSLQLKESTIARLATYKQAVRIWEARK